jgi:hypothetical protein
MYCLPELQLMFPTRFGGLCLISGALLRTDGCRHGYSDKKLLLSLRAAKAAIYYKISRHRASRILAGC